MTDLHAVVGAGGGIGGAIVRALADAGRPVRALARRSLDVPTGVEQRQVDLGDVDATAAALAGAAVVYHCAMPSYHRWAQEFPTLTRAVADAAARAGAGLVVADNLYTAPGDGRPITETDAPVPHGPKARTRAAMRAELLARGDLRVTFGRGADYYGAGPRGLNSVPGNTLFARAVAGRRMFWPGRLDQLHALHYLPDLARALVLLADSAAPWGRTWNLPSPEPLTGRQYAAAASLARRPRVTPIPKLALRAAGLVDVQARGVAEIFWQFDRPFLIDAAAFETHIGRLPLTPHAEAVARTMTDLRSHPPARR
ncbi:NAD-dependent epimerase/dehydratase family protein [Actinoplanes sp. NPDC049265]|uniref:NAD-dependent epimerase/dehydratase family protein n=1 Tax=Actinoplanes sp. NPDC049265 TaxID=3363902 RepID=UPI00371E88C2